MNSEVEALREPDMVSKIDALVGRTIVGSRLVKSRDKRIQMLLLTFADGDYCLISSSHPSMGVHLAGDTERVIPDVKEDSIAGEG